MPQLAVQGFHVFRGDRHVLRGIGFELPAGRCLQVTGRNGAGKTTLLRALCGLVDVEAGSVLWDGVEVDRREPEFHAQLAYLGHDAPLKGDLTGRENLRYCVGLRRAIRREELDRGLERVGAQPFADRPVRSLSAGQRRRIALAALWLYGVSLWILDEPTTNLDAQGQQLVTGMILEHIAGGGSVVAAVHHELELPPERRVELVIGGTA
ncbi:MAG: cytochrome c biogenesis heme-transporting ATPase CcmA [Steroidobacteraceae bacterium]